MGRCLPICLQVPTNHRKSSSRTIKKIFLTYVKQYNCSSISITLFLVLQNLPCHLPCFLPSCQPTQSPKAGSIAMAPSFNLFNQSFDSFGDTFNVVGNLDASLQSASFGTGPTASGEFGTVGSNLQRSLSGGNYAQQLLGSSSGGLTFGMSPVNSFGNGPSAAPPSRRGGSTMMVLGGQDARSASPTQVLGMYHSYSGGGGGSQGMLRPNNSMGPLEDSHLRLSATSFGGAPSLSQNYTRSFGAEGSSTMPYNGRMAHYHDGEGGQLFYIFLKRHKAAFSHCTFLLPGLKAALLEGLDNSKAGDDNMVRTKITREHRIARK